MGGRTGGQVGGGGAGEEQPEGSGMEVKVANSTAGKLYPSTFGADRAFLKNLITLSAILSK